MNAYVFPGQGGQTPGMGKDLYARSRTARDLMESANEILGFRITDLMFEGTEEDLLQTKVTQPAVFLHSVALAKCAIESGMKEPDMVAGHSLGEYSALVVSGVLGFEDALHLVSARALAMQECCEKNPGTMAAIIGFEGIDIENICRSISTQRYGTVIPANFNNPSQIVISGDRKAVLQACRLLKEAGVRRALPLSVSGAFHSPLMEGARETLARAINATPFSQPRCPIYQNVTALPSRCPQTIKENILSQLTSPVRWTQEVMNMIIDGARNFVEMGPGTALAGMISKTAPSTGIQIDVKSMNTIE